MIALRSHLSSRIARPQGRTSALVTNYDKICKIKYLVMAEQLVFEMTIWVSNIAPGSPGNQPFFGHERYTRDAAVSVPPANEHDYRLMWDPRKAANSLMQRRPIPSH